MVEFPEDVSDDRGVLDTSVVAQKEGREAEGVEVWGEIPSLALFFRSVLLLIFVLRIVLFRL